VEGKQLRLTHVEKLKGDAVWLRYEMVKGCNAVINGNRLIGVRAHNTAPIFLFPGVAKWLP
jgi:hypothetical protein